ncbi:peptidoglycan DD-metalloendopeptidase family protein [Candidatus Nomurabacteria bacterium]|nr:peptidoglycan DD-metalloendopeptidase family protein [Candidatus Nomurabacteria bacterium]
MSTNVLFKYCSIFIVAFCILSLAQTTYSATIDELNTKISTVKTILPTLEKEIEEQQKLIEKVSGEAKTLANDIKILDTTKKKLDTSVKVTQNNIQTTELTLQQLSLEISEKQKKIDDGEQAIIQSIKNIKFSDDQSMIESLLIYDNMSEFWNNIENLSKFQNEIKQSVSELKILKKELEDKKLDVTTKKNKLVALKNDLAGEKKAIEYTQKTKSQILTTTKNREANYKKILAEKLAQKEAFEKDLFQYESTLKLIIDPNSIPASKTGILDWPLDKPFITQYFGKTVDAKRLYVSGSHNGVDFRASIGTPIKASLDGVVTATGNTDSYAGCYSYGKWILIKHENGLSTIYSHLSVISVSAGENITDGQVIGYSGSTGYATGPHLHFGVFATQGLRVAKYENSKFCKGATIPLADSRAYLDPMTYLPR